MKDEEFMAGDGARLTHYTTPALCTELHPTAQHSTALSRETLSLGPHSSPGSQLTAWRPVSPGTAHMGLASWLLTDYLAPPIWH